MMNAISWLDTQSYVERVAWFGCFTTALDDFATGKNALLNKQGGLADGLLVCYPPFLVIELAAVTDAFLPRYAYTLMPDRRDSLELDIRRSRRTISN